MIYQNRWLKKFGVAVVLASLFGCCISKAVISITLDWNANSDPSVAGYNVYYGTASRAYSSASDVGTNTQAVVNNLAEGQTYYFAVTAYTYDGFESDYSGEVSYLVPGQLTITPGASASDPMRIRFSVAPGHTYDVQFSTDLQNWATVWETTDTVNEWLEYDATPTGVGGHYYRVVQH